MEATAPRRGFDPDVRRWGPQTRRQVSLVVLGLAGAFLIAALLFFGINAPASGWFLWLTIGVLAVLLLVEAVVVATGIASEEGAGPAWLRGEPAHAAAAGTAPPSTDEPEPAGETIELRCPECAEMFAVEDTGERPLHTECPHCGAEGHVDIDEPPEQEDEPASSPYSEHVGDESADTAYGQAAAEPEPEPEEPAAEGEPESVGLKCPACDTQFEVEDTGERPLEATCPGCGRSGKLS